MAPLENYLVAGNEYGVPDRNAIDQGSRARHEALQKDSVASTLQPCMLLGEAGLVDTYGGVLRAPHHAGLPHREAPAKQLPPHSTEDDSRVSGVFASRRCKGINRKVRSLHQYFNAIKVDRITGSKQRHPLHRPSVHMDAAHAVRDLEPQAATIHAELGQQRTLDRVAEREPTARLADHAVYAGRQDPIILLLVGEMKSKVVHAARG